MILSSFFDLFSYSFMVKALIAGVCIAISSSMLGVTVVMKRESMLGDGLSHVAFGACAIALAIGAAPLAFALPITILVSIFIILISNKKKIFGDSIIALIASSSLAIGYIIMHVSGSSVEVENYLYGQIYGISIFELILCIIVSLIVVCSFVLLYNRIFLLTFDLEYAKSTGIKTNLYSVIISILISITVVIGMKLVGALLISSLIIFPSISAKQIFKTFKSVVIASAIISVLCVIIGVIVNYYIDIPVGSTIVVINLIGLIISIIIGKIIRNQSKS